MFDLLYAGRWQRENFFFFCVCDRKIARYLNLLSVFRVLGFSVSFSPFSLIQGLLVSQSELLHLRGWTTLRSTGMCTSTSKNMFSQRILKPCVREKGRLSQKPCIPAGIDAWVCGTEHSCCSLCTFCSASCKTAFQFSVQFCSMNLTPCETSEGTKLKKELLLLWLTMQKCYSLLCE